MTDYLQTHPNSVSSGASLAVNCTSIFAALLTVLFPTTYLCADFAADQTPWCNLNVKGGNGPGPDAGCNCTVESAPLGLTPDATGQFAEDHIRAALRQLKERNPNISTV